MKLIDKKLLIEELCNHYKVDDAPQNRNMDMVIDLVLRMPEVDTVDVCLATLSGMMGAIKALARGDLDA